MKKCIKLYVQNIHHYYNDKNIDTVSDKKKIKKQDDSAHEIKYMKQKKYQKTSIKLFWID